VHLRPKYIEVTPWGVGIADGRYL